MLIDATSLAIINQLKDGRASYKKIAEELSLAEGTVRSRVKKLMDEGVLSISGLVNPEALARSADYYGWRQGQGDGSGEKRRGVQQAQISHFRLCGYRPV